MDHSKSLFVYTYGLDASIIPPGLIADSLSNYLKITVDRIDQVDSYSKLYYFVHFLEPVPTTYREELQKFGKQFLFTTKGLLQIGLNTSNGLDPTTKDIITQYKNKDGEWYFKELNNNEIFKWNEELSIWSSSTVNPFVVLE
jgi:hypothetical protein